MSPFECTLGYQPPLFPAQEVKVAVPSACDPGSSLHPRPKGMALSKDLPLKVDSKKRSSQTPSLAQDPPHLPCFPD